jgi:hypothetical protein
MRAFYSALEDKLKRFQPIDYAPFASLMMRKGLDDLRTGVFFPPFKILHSIEANCSYVRGQNRDVMNQYRLGAVMNVWHDHENPLFEDAISENVQHFVLLMHRQQMELQYHHSLDETARMQLLFVSGNPMPNVSAEFPVRYGLTIEKWMHLCCLTYFASNQDPTSCFKKSAIRAYKRVETRDEEIDAFFKLASRTPEEIRERFRSDVFALGPELRFLARSVFLDRPVIDFGGDRMIAPLPDLLLRSSGYGAYKLIKALPSFGGEFGSSVQKYVGNVLRSLSGIRLLLEGTEIERLANGEESCDYLVELDDCILLVECKATTFVATGLLEHVIRNDGSTGKVADGVVQLYSTLYMISSDAFASRGVSQDKPVIGIVATFGDFPLVNSDWYFESFVMERTGADLSPPIYPSNRMKRRPLILSLRALEHLVMLVNTLGTSVESLYAEKQSLPYIQTGDWLEFTRKKLMDLGKGIKSLPFLQEEFDRLVKSVTGTLPPWNEED